MVMKVGIITFHQAANYGAVLQAYALYHAIGNLGIECEIIDYRNTSLENTYKRITLKNANTVRQVVSAIIYGKTRNKKLDAFNGFVEKYCKLSNTCYRDNNIDKAGAAYDVIITGSDQVWNLGLTGQDYHYFLDFASNNVKKCSYAASIAFKNISFGQEDHIRDLLKEFQYISLREQAGSKYVGELLGSGSLPVVLDPTLLLEKEDWIKIANENPIDIKLPVEYLLCYFVSPTNEQYVEAIRIAQEKNLPIVLINYSHRKVKGMMNLTAVSPGQFVYLFNKASFIVTNSFHGTAFSINLQKEFVFMLNDKVPEKNERIETLVKNVGLNDRDIKLADMSEKIDWDIVGCSLKKLRSDSLKALSEEIFGEAANGVV